MAEIHAEQFHQSRKSINYLRHYLQKKVLDEPGVEA